VAEDDEADELREKLRPIFDQFDADGSGSVSTDEVGQMAMSLGMELTSEQLEQLMLDADPDGSGEIEFEELIDVLKRQSQDGAEGGMVALLQAVDDDDGGVASMVLYEFIHALVRLAWECYPKPGIGIGGRLGALLERAVLPGSSHLLDSTDPMEAELSSKHVQAITAFYNDRLLEAFKLFAAADSSLSGQATLDTMSFEELVFMVKTTKLYDSHLTVAGLTAIFAQVNTLQVDDGEKDDDADELNFAEFKNCLCRIANAKVPPSVRGGEPFANVWQAFLQIMFLPQVKKLLKDAKRGTAVKLS